MTTQSIQVLYLFHTLSSPTDALARITAEKR
jgi:hypothetical protein